jgi:hypothetical protein
VKIRFETTIDDVIAFNRFHYANSPAWRKQVWVRALSLPLTLAIVFAMIVIIFATAEPAPDPLALAVMSICMGATWLVMSIVGVLFIRWNCNRALVRGARRFLAEGSNRSMFGWREMEIVDGRLVLHTELLELSMDLRAIEKIVSNDEYTFVYIASISAYMIPMHHHREEEHREFVAELREAWDNRAVPLPADDDPPRRRQVNEGFVKKDW